MIFIIEINQKNPQIYSNLLSTNCHSTCSSCLDGSPNNCTSCENDMFLVIYEKNIN
jgi:hypothetical protein